MKILRLLIAGMPLILMFVLWLVCQLFEGLKNILVPAIIKLSGWIGGKKSDVSKNKHGDTVVRPFDPYRKRVGNKR